TYCRKGVSKGLYWATFNKIRQQHDVALRNLITKRSKGLPASFKFKRWEGEGMVAVQVSLPADRPRTRRSPEALQKGEATYGPLDLRIEGWVDPTEFDHLPRSKKRMLARQGRVDLPIGGGRSVPLQVLFHRMIPREAEILEVLVTRRRVANKYRSSISFCVREPRPPRPESADAIVGISIGWKSYTGADGKAIQVATIHSENRPLPEVPADLVMPNMSEGCQWVQVSEDGRDAAIYLPEAYLHAAARPERIRS